MIRFRRYYHSLLSVLFLAIGAAGCGSGVQPEAAAASLTPPPEPPAPPAPRPLKVVTPELVAEGYLPNPYMGWQQDPLQGEARFPYSVAYARIDWNVLNPADGQYNWTAIETLRQEALQAGSQYSFRVRPSRPPPEGEGHVVPEWVVQQGALIVRGYRGTEPLYASCLYLAAHGRFIEALRQEFDGDPPLAFLDVGSYGYFGGWFTDQYNDQPDSLDWQARRWVADMYLGGEATRPCLDAFGQMQEVAYHYKGFQKTQLVMPYVPGYEDSLEYVLGQRPDVGIRHDSLGSRIQQARFPPEIKALFDQTWPREPIVFEFASEASTAAALVNARAFAQEMHASFVNETLAGRGDPALLADLLKVIGYQLALQEMQYAPQARAAGSMAFSMTWHNLGSAPPYVRLPIMLYLVDSQNKVWAEMVVETADTRTWLPGEAIEVEDQVRLPVELPAGRYELHLAVMDPANEQSLNLFMSGRNEAGRYSIGPIEVMP